MPALSLCILWCMFLSGESRKEAICANCHKNLDNSTV